MIGWISDRTLSGKDPPMKFKKYILVVAVVLTVGFISAGSALACSKGGPPPDTASIQAEQPTI